MKLKAHLSLLHLCTIHMHKSDTSSRQVVVYKRAQTSHPRVLLLSVERAALFWSFFFFFFLWPVWLQIAWQVVLLCVAGLAVVRMLLLLLLLLPSFPNCVMTLSCPAVFNKHACCTQRCHHPCLPTTYRPGHCCQR